MKRTLLILLIPFFLSATTPESPEDYLLLTSRFRHTQAFDHLVALLEKETRPEEQQYALLRMETLIPEISSRTAIPALEKLLQHKTIDDRTTSRDQVRNMLVFQYLRSGNLKKADDLCRSMGFLSFEALGPFTCASIIDFSRTHPPDKNPGERLSHYQGRTRDITWFRVKPDRQGILAFSELMENTRDTMFYLHARVNIESDGIYHLMLGKTGFCSVTVDGTAVFRDAKKHLFHHDQYHITLNLTRGSHDILIRLSDTSSRCTLSARFLDSAGRACAIIPSAETPAGKCVQSQADCLYPSAGESQRNSGDYFRKAFILLQSGLHDEQASDVTEMLSRIDTSSAYYPHARYLGSLCTDSPEQKGVDLPACLHSDPGHIGALRDLVSLRRENNVRFAAWELLNGLKNIPELRKIYLQERCKLFFQEGWYTEAVKDAEELAGNDPAGYLSLSMINRNLGCYLEASRYLETYLRHEAYSPEETADLAELYIRSGQGEKAIGYLYQAISVFPSRLTLRLSLARLLEARGRTDEAITVLTSALAVSPQNAAVLEAMGRSLHRRGHHRSAVSYVSRSLQWAPDNFALRQYLAVLSHNDNSISGHLCTANPETLAEKVTDRSDNAVLLDETALTLFNDGSTERTVRRVYLVNDPSQAESLHAMSVVLDPGLDIVENMECVVIHDGTRSVIRENYRQPLSDPESRLYYNFEAMVMPLPAIEKGSIIDFHYTVKKSRDRESDSNFSEKITRSSPWKTLNLSMILSLPSDRRVRIHGRNLNPAAIRDEKTNGRRVISLSLRDLSPADEEPGMPPLEEFYPSLYLSTFDTWDDFAAWYLDLVKGRDTVSMAMRNDLKKTVNDTDDPLVKAGKIYGLVTGRIRYVGFELGTGGIRPRSIEETYLTRMGDCKDTALLLSALLREAGIKAHLALVRTRDRGRGDFTVPHVGEFNHAIVYVPAAQGIPAPFFLDATVSGADIREIPHNDMDIPAFVVNGRASAFTDTGSTFYDRDLQRVYNRVVVDRDGNASIKRRLAKTGPGAYEAREELLNPDRQMHSLRQYWNSRFPGSVVDDFRINSNIMNAPVDYEYRLHVPGLAGQADAAMVIPSFLTGTGYYRSLALADSRAYPVSFEGKSVVEETTDFIFPEGFTLFSMPEGGNYSTGFCDASFSFSSIPGGVRSVSRITIKSARVEPGEYGKFRDFARFVSRCETGRIVMTAK